MKFAPMEKDVASVLGSISPPACSNCQSSTASPDPDTSIWADLVRTRLRPPVKAGAILVRGRLDELFSEVRTRPLTVVRAPAGYGKSSILAQWFDRLVSAGVAVGWLSLDKEEEDFTRFFGYLVASVQELRPKFAKRLAILLRSAQRPPMERIRTAFCNAVLDIREPVYLFIDDFHLLHDPDAIGTLRSIIDLAPENLHLVVATRHTLPFSVSYLRSKGMVLEIDGNFLRFDKDETSEFLLLSGQKGLSEGEIATLVQKTEGWAAGLQLASISLSHRKNSDDFFSFISGRHSHLSEYLADDVINSQRQSTIDFLIETSILPRLCPALCSAVTGRANVSEEIDLLEKQSLFLFSLDSEGTWYRYHHLFAQFLQKRLREQEPGMAATLHRRASDWFSQQGMVEDALFHSIEGGDMERAAQLLDRSCNRLFYKGGLTTLLRWADKIPAKVLRGFPRARLEIAWSIILEWRFEAAAEIIRDVEEVVFANPEYYRELYGGEIDAIIMHRKVMLSHFMDENGKCTDAIARFTSEAKTSDPYLLGNIETCSIYVGRESYRLQGMDRMDRRAREFYEKAGSIFVLVWHETILGPTFFLRGDTELAEKSLREAMSMAEIIDGGISPLVAMPALLLAELLYERDDLDKARDLLDRYGPLAEKQGFVDHLTAYYMCRSRLLARRGDQEDARAVLRSARQSAERHGFARLLAFVDQEDVRLAIRSNDMDAVKRYLGRLDEEEVDLAIRPGPHTTSRHEAATLAWCRAMSAINEHSQAILVLRRWAAFANGRAAQHSEVKLLVVLAVVLALDGREGEALRTLREAVKKAARPRFVSAFLDEGRAIQTLLQKLFQGADEAMGPTTGFGLDLIRRFADAEGGHAEEAPQDAPAKSSGELNLPEQMNEREAEVLRLVAMGMSNKEIGDRLGLTEGSVKWYLQQIFLKLDVRRRAMAVAKAKKFGLI
jgi:LuxR family maltose regulon positive regulatory protein